MTTTQLDTENLGQFGSRLGTATQQQNAAQGALDDLTPSMTTMGTNGPAAGDASLAQANASRNGAAGGGDCGDNNAADDGGGGDCGGGDNTNSTQDAAAAV